LLSKVLIKKLNLQGGDNEKVTRFSCGILFGLTSILYIVIYREGYFDSAISPVQKIAPVDLWAEDA
jgi:hypothetical protein